MIVNAVIGSLTAILVALIGVLGRLRLQAIHLLVNDRLDKALAEIVALKEELAGKDIGSR